MNSWLPECGSNTTVSEMRASIRAEKGSDQKETILQYVVSTLTATRVTLTATEVILTTTAVNKSFI